LLPELFFSGQAYEVFLRKAGVSRFKIWFQKHFLLQFFYLYCPAKNLVMKTNRLSEGLRKTLNDQMTKEAWQSQVYLSYASWASSAGYEGIANFLFRHAEEERNHMMKFLEYILERGAPVKVEAIPGPGSEPSSVQDCFNKVFEQEVSNTKGIYKLVKMSFDEEDWATWHFMQWFVKEQTEEETLALSLLDKIKIAGGEKATGSSLYSLDKDLHKMSGEASLAEEKSATNP
jgi:ferritin